MSSGIEEQEEVEVRGLLNRHRNRILVDLEHSSMLTVLVKKNVISVITEALLNNFLPEDQRRRCDLLIDTIAQCGFRKFKEFCYAIEEECPVLIHEMINDKSAEPSNDADEVKLMMHTSPEQGDTLDKVSPDVQLQPVGGDPIYPETTPTAALGNPPDDGDDDNGGGLYESVDRNHRSASYYDPPKMMVPPVPMQRTSMLATTHTQPTINTTPSPNVADIVTKFNQNPKLKLIKSASVISTTSTSSHCTSTSTEGATAGGGVGEGMPETATDSQIHAMLPPTQGSSSISTSSKDSSHYSQTLPHKSKSQSSGLAKLEKIYQTIYSGTLRRNKSQKKERPEYMAADAKVEGAAAQEPVAVKKRDKAALKYRHSCSNQDEAIYVAAKKFGAKKRKERNRRQYHSMNETIEVLADQVVEDDALGERSTWEYHTLTVTRVTGYGFGIAVSGGRDNPHFANGDPSIAVSDVLKGGPAEEKLQVNDRIISVNGVSLENVEYATAVQVLRDSGNTVSLVVRRRVMNLNFLNSPSQTNTLTNSAHQHQHSISSNGLAGSAAGTSASNGLNGSNANTQQTIKVSIAKTNKKDDFGIVLGCRLFVKEISSKVKEQLTANGYSLQEGDIVTRIHNTNCGDAMSVKEAKKIIDSCKDRLNMVVARDLLSGSPTVPGTPSYSHTAQVSNCSNIDESFLPGGASYSSQNLYVQPPTRPSNVAEDKSNLTPRGRSRNPLLDASNLSQLDRPQTPPSAGHLRSRSGVDETPNRPPMPREDFYSSRSLYDDDPLHRAKQSAEPRFITFQKEGSVGIRLTGGNEAGIFVTAVQPGSPASLQGLTPGDKILKVNDMDMAGVTREEAVLYLLSLQDRIDLIVQHSREEYDTVVASQRGDSFHIKTHFHCENPLKGEMSFKAGDVFRVTDTLHNGVVGSWQVQKIGRNHQEMQKGVIPNKSRAEELATAQFNASKKEMNATESRGSFFRRKRSAHRRSKSLNRENWDDVVFSDAISKFPAYERVVLRHPGFVRPVCLFGPIADVARERLMKEIPDKFTAPYQDDMDKGSSKCGIVRLSNIRDIMDRGKHALLDITPNAVDRLNYAQFYPIVIFLRTDNKMAIKRLRQGVPKAQHKSSKKLLEQCQKLEKIWSHVFSVQISLTDDPDACYRQVRDIIDQQQSGAVWMSATKPAESLSDDFLFPMNTSRLSYASSPESDLELSPGPSASLSLGNLPQLVKSSSDPSIATNQDNLDRDRELGDALPPPYTNHYDSGSNRRSGIHQDGKFPYAMTNGVDMASLCVATRTPGGQTIYGVPPDLPPRIDRASKPNGLVIPTSPIRNGSAAKNSSIHSIATLGRSSQDRLFSPSKMSGEAENDHEEYASRNQLMANKRLNGSSTERSQASIDRQSRPLSSNVKMGNESYDSVSSYDSYNAAARLGPNTPDDLKSAPRPAADYIVSSPSKPSMGHHPAMDYSRPPPSAGHHAELSRSLSSGPIDLNRANYLNGGGHPPAAGLPQRPTNLGLDPSPRKMLPFEAKTDYGKYSRNNSASQADYKTTPKSPLMGVPPPTTPGGTSSSSGGGVNSGMPFKPVPPPKPKNYRPPMQNGMNDHHGQQQQQQQHHQHWENGMDQNTPRSPAMNGYGGNNGGGGGGGGGGVGNGYYPNPSMGHYHSQPNAMTMQGHGPYPGYPNGNNGPPPMPPMMSGNGHYNGNGPNPLLGYNNNNTNGNHHHNTNYHGQPVYNGGQYMHRGFGNAPNSGIDLAGSREQRGSAFELYRKPQIGAGGMMHPHGHSAYDPSMSHANSQGYYAAGPQYMNHNYHNSYPPQHTSYGYPPGQYRDQNTATPPPLPPPLNAKKKKLLKSPLTVIKNVFMRTTKPLRRQSSLAEADKKMKAGLSLRRQHSMMEPRNAQLNQNMDPRYQHYQQLPNRPPIPVNGGYAPGAYPQNQPPYPYNHRQPDALNSTYQNFQTESPYQQGAGAGGSGGYSHEYDHESENLYSNRALIELQENQQRPPAQRGIVRRHSLADRPASAMNFRRTPQSEMQRERRSRHQSSSVEPLDEPIYQSRGGSYMLKQDSSFDHGGDRISRPNYATQQRPERSRSIDPTYQSRREMHRDHLYQSRTEMQQRITQSRTEVERGTSEAPSESSSNSGTPTHPIRDPIYVTRKELKESGFKTRTQLRDHLYHTRREAMETMAEPMYVTKTSVQHTPIYETNREHEVSQEVLSADQVVIEPVPHDGNRSDNSNHSDLEEKLKGINIQSEHGSADGTQPFSKSRDGDDSQDTVINVQTGTPPPSLLGMSNSNDGTIEEITVIAASDAAPPLSSTMSPTPSARSSHISNMIKRTAPHLLPPPPPPPLEDEDMPAPLPQEVDPTLLSMECRRKMMASRTSIETQYTSQASLPSTIGPPNASSTPYASDLSIAVGVQSGNPSLVTPREPTTTRGEFGENGGVLSDPVWNVSLEIPKGALPSGRMQEIYFTVTDPRLSECVGGPPLDMENGETMLSPLVMCGPQGLEFLVPVTLNIPHCAGQTTSLGIALKATDSESNLKTSWDNIELPSNAAAHTVSVKVDHF